MLERSKRRSRANTATAATFISSYRFQGLVNGFSGSPGAVRPKKWLGSASSIPLVEARDRASAARRRIANGFNPIEERKQHQQIPTFGDLADEVRESLSAGFRNEKHKAQWKSTLETYAASLRAKPVDTITTDDILAVLKPIWTVKPETASRVRGRIEKVLDAAKARGYRDAENPARWRGHLDNLLPRLRVSVIAGQ